MKILSSIEITWSDCFDRSNALTPFRLFIVCFLSLVNEFIFFFFVFAFHHNNTREEMNCVFFN